MEQENFKVGDLVADNRGQSWTVTAVQGKGLAVKSGICASFLTWEKLTPTVKLPIEDSAPDGARFWRWADTLIFQSPTPWTHNDQTVVQVPEWTGTEGCAEGEHDSIRDSAQMSARRLRRVALFLV